jgi:Ca2+-binding EF-hand superfamily protein
MKGVNKVTFCNYYDLPGIFSERLFSVFDLNNNGYLDSSEFVNGMKMLFTESYENFVKFIFDFYDFDKDGKISREDMQIVLSYIPLNTAKERLSGYKLKFER